MRENVIEDDGERCYPVSVILAAAEELREQANGIEPTIEEVVELLESRFHGGS